MKRQSAPRSQARTPTVHSAGRTGAPVRVSTVPVSGSPTIRLPVDRQSAAGAVQALVSAPGPGFALPMQVAKPIESSLGLDVSTVRVHSGGRVARIVDGVGARAFAFGNGIFLGSGQSATDLRLMAHEAAHVAQQSWGAGRIQAYTPSRGDAFESEARSVSDAVARGGPAPIRLRTGGPAIQGDWVSVLGTSDDTETSADSPSATQSIIKGAGAGDFVNQMRAQASTPFSDTQHPAFAQQGIESTGARGQKSALIIGNVNYTASTGKIRFSQLPGVKKDMDAMKVKAARKGFVTLARTNLTAPEMQGGFNTTLGNAGRGDSVLLYFAGHGIPQGMVGVDAEVVNITKGSPKRPKVLYDGHVLASILPYEPVITAMDTAVSRGVNVTFIVDACHSGVATDLVRTLAIEKLVKKGDSRLAEILGMIAGLEFYKSRIPSSHFMWVNFLYPLLKATGAYTMKQLKPYQARDKSLSIPDLVPAFTLSEYKFSRFESEIAAQLSWLDVLARREVSLPHPTPTLQIIQSLKKVNEILVPSILEMRKNYWRNVAFKVLALTSAYIFQNGGPLMPLDKTSVDYASAAAVEQQFNRFINALIDLGEQKSAQPKVP